MYYAYVCIYWYILWYTDIYYFNKVYTRIYSYVLCISVYILLNTSPRDFPWDLDLSFSWNLMLLYIWRCPFLRKQCYSTSANIRKLGYFITLVRGCPGSQLSKGIEINEDILRYATVHTLIYACFLMCIWTPLESWLPGQPLEIIYVCVYRLIYGSIALDFSYGKENEKNAMLYWVYTGLYSVQISIYRYTTLYPSMKPEYLGIYAYEQVQDRIYAYERCISAYKSVYTRIYAYVTFCKNMHDSQIRTGNLMHTARLLWPLCHQRWYQTVYRMIYVC